MDARKLWTAIGIATVCFAGGYGAAKWSAPSNAPAVADGSLKSESAATIPAPPAEDGKVESMFASAVPTGSGVYQRLRSLVDRIATMPVSEFPAELARAEREMSEDPGPLIAVTMMLRRWVSEDPIGMLRAAVSGRFTSLRSSYDYGLLKAAVEHDPDMAWSVVTLARSPRMRDALIGNYLTAFVIKDPAASLERVLSLDPPLSGNILQRYLSDLGQIDMQLAISAAKRFPAFAASVIEGSAVYEQAKEKSPEEMTAWIAEMTGGERKRAIGNAAFALAERGFERALDWIRELDSTAERSAALTSLLRTHGRKHPAQAAEAALEIASPRMRASVLHIVTYSWFKQEGDVAADWLNENTSGSVRLRGFRTIVDYLFDETPFPRNPREWLPYVEELGAQEPMRIRFVRTWAAMDPTGVEEYVMGLEKPRDRTLSIRQIVHDPTYRERLEDETVRAQTHADIVAEWLEMKKEEGEAE